MNEPPKSAETDPLTEPGPDDELPPGDHALEVAARRGFWPLSPAAKRVWHGGAIPCVTCGQLVRRGEDHCDHCGQDLSEEMVEKMRAHAGPWYVLEHLRPFPGVALDRIVRQIRRGLITETSIVRGPSTDYQWRFAVETPGLCRYFARCWHCHHAVNPSDAYCQSCLSYLSFERPRPLGPVNATFSEPRAADLVTTPQTASERGAEAARSADAQVHSEPWEPALDAKRQGSVRANAAILDRGSELARLAKAVRRLEAIPPVDANPPRTGTVAAMMIVAALVVAVLGLLLLTNLRRQVIDPSSLTTPDPVAPVSP